MPKVEDVESFKPTPIKELRTEFNCSEEAAVRLQEVQQLGYDHGAKGWYSNNDYSSDADWVNGAGAKIQKLEEELGSDADVSQLYVDAHADGMAVYDKWLDQEEDDAVYLENEGDDS